MTSTVGETNFDQLPKNAKKYIKTIEELANIPIVMISTGPSRDQVIFLKKLFT